MECVSTILDPTTHKLNPGQWIGKMPITMKNCPLNNQFSSPVTLYIIKLHSSSQGTFLTSVTKSSCMIDLSFGIERQGRTTGAIIIDFYKRISFLAHLHICLKGIQTGVIVLSIHTTF